MGAFGWWFVENVGLYVWETLRAKPATSVECAIAHHATRLGIGEVYLIPFGLSASFGTNGTIGFGREAKSS